MLWNRSREIEDAPMPRSARNQEEVPQVWAQRAKLVSRNGIEDRYFRLAIELNYLIWIDCQE
jgi:hypothetical protein